MLYSLQARYTGNHMPHLTGTTTVECKTGYGLETEAEIMLLQFLQRAKEELPIEISITYCGAHAVPK
jgi:imidazolonepropionase